MLKIITPLLLATALPLFAQTDTMESKTTITQTTTSDQPMATPTPMTSTTTTKTVEVSTPTETKTAEGVLAEINEGANFFSVIVPDSSIPMKFMYGDTITMSDLNAKSVMWNNVKLGQALTVTYTPSPDQLMATNVAFGDPDKLVPVQTSPTAVTTTTTEAVPAIKVMPVTTVPVTATEETTTTTTTTDAE